MRAIRYLLLPTLALMCACGRAPEPAAPPKATVAEAVDPRLPSITISGDESGAAAWNWQPPRPVVLAQDVARAKRDAAKALAQARLYTETADAIPLYLALKEVAPADAEVTRGLEKSLRLLLRQGDAALRSADDDADALSRAGEIAAVARTLAPEDPEVVAYLSRADLADQLWRLNAEGDAPCATIGSAHRARPRSPASAKC